MKRNGWLAMVLAAVCVLAAVADAQDEVLAAGSPWTSPLGMEFAWVPAGSFEMGSPEGEAGRDSDERQHAVRISEGFWMGVYEVTQGEWEVVMGSNPSYFGECGARCPVEEVSWEDVREFIRRLNAWESGSENRYRLPTEAEWEYAVRAGSTGATPEGDLKILGAANAPVLDPEAWYGGNSEVSYGGSDCSGWDEKQYEAELCGPHPVGLKRANGWGLHDMLGNVTEWTGDWYGEYPTGAVTDPRGPSTGSNRVGRGGSWLDYARYVRPAARGSAPPSTRHPSVGFRLVRAKLEEVAAWPGGSAGAGGQDGDPRPRAAGNSWESPQGMEFVWVPAGRFEMGSPEGEAGRNSDERQYGVRISEGFWMGRYEVTQGEWEAAMGSNPSRFQSCGARCPVEGVSWEDVQEFVRGLNERESGSGSQYRLPTEAEWEYAARAGSAGATPEGELRILGENNAPVLNGQAWYAGNSGVSYAGAWDCSEWEEMQYEAEWCGPHAVGLKRANGWGLHDMLGNVWEWMADWYGEEYPSGLVTDPRGPATGSRRVVRGGSWDFTARSVRSAARFYASPGFRNIGLGFRLVRTD